jgi:hypothetical protein
MKKKQKIKPRIFLHQKSSNGFISLDSYCYWCSMNLTSFGFSYRDPSRSCFTLDSGVTPFGQRANPYRDFRHKNIRAGEDVFISLLFTPICQRANLYRDFTLKNIRAGSGRFHKFIVLLILTWIAELLAEIASPVRYRSCPHSSG